MKDFFVVKINYRYYDQLYVQYGSVVPLKSPLSAARTVYYNFQFKNEIDKEGCRVTDVSYVKMFDTNPDNDIVLTVFSLDRLKKWYEKEKLKVIERCKKNREKADGK